MLLHAPLVILLIMLIVGISWQIRLLLNIHRQFIIEEQILKNPEKLNAMAQADLGMFLLQPDQIIPASYEHGDSENREKFSSNLDRSKEPVQNIAFNGL